MESAVNLSDETLMQQVAAGQRALIEPLIRRHAGPLLTFIRRMIGDHHRGEELFQDVFLTVWRKRAQYQYPRRFRAWLFTIAVNKCHEAGRLRRRAAVSLAGLNETALARDRSPDGALLTAETAHLVASAVLLLPAQQRSVVVLRIWQELSYGEIAVIVGCGEATVRSHMHHGLLALRKHLEPHLLEQ